MSEPKPTMPDYQYLRTWQRWAAYTVLAGIVLWLSTSWRHSARLWQAYVCSFFACWQVSIGAMGLIAIGNLTGGRWAIAARPVYRALINLMPLIAILFIPIAVFADRIYPWVPENTQLHLQPSKRAYFDMTFFLARAVGYFVVWLFVAWWLSRNSRLDSLPGSTPAARRAGALSLVLIMPTATFAAIDWGMSLEPLWFSSIYGAILIAGGVVSAHGLAICCSSPTNYAYSLEASASVQNDLGNLLLAFMMVFAYFAFSQFLIIWSGNLPIEIVWYERRFAGAWFWMAIAIAFLAFIIPFFALLSRDLKRSPDRVAKVAALLIFMQVVHTYWVIVPAFEDSGFGWQLSNMGALCMVCGLGMVAYLANLQRQLAHVVDFTDHSERGGE